MSSFVCIVSPIVRIMVILSVLTITHYGGLTTNLFCYVLHRLHELLLMELLGCVIVLCLCIGWLIVVVWGNAHCLSHRLKVLTMTVHGTWSTAAAVIIERLSPRLSHGGSLILKLERPLAWKTNLVLLLHLVDLRLLLLHDFGQLQLVLQLRVVDTATAALGCRLPWVVHLDHLVLTTRLVELHWDAILVLDRLRVVRWAINVRLSDLISNS